MTSCRPLPRLGAASPLGPWFAGPGCRPQLSGPAVSDDSRSLFRFSLSSALSFFGPSLGTSFCSSVPRSLLWPLLTSPRLSAQGPPRVSAWSFRSRLWALQDAISDSWALWLLAHWPLTSCLTAHLCSFGRAFASHPFAPASCEADLAVWLRLASQAPVGNLSSR